MASLRTSAAQTALRESRKPYICPRCELRRMGCSVINYPIRRAVRYSSTSSISEPPIPPLLSKLKTDLKTAMKAKDTPRLNVVRAMITEYNNASKTANPISTDLQLLALLKKRKASSEAAAAEAKAANRSDLEEKQRQEIQVMDQYAGQVQILSEEQIRELISKTLTDIRQGTNEQAINVGNALKELFKAGGVLDGKPADRGQVAKVLKAMLDGN